jgi:DNA polymerase III delta subunit
MTESDFRAELKSLHGGYLFFGGEDYLKYTYSKEVYKRVLDGTFDEFNHIVIYGEEFTPAVLSQAIGALPMMAEKKLVEVRCVDFNSIKKDTLLALCDVLSTLSENEHTVLIIRADNDFFTAGRLPNNPSEVYRALTKYLTPVEFEFPTPSRLKSWVIRHFSDNQTEFDPSLTDKLVEVCGHDMWTLSNEIDKLSAYIKCMDELKAGNREFEAAARQTKKALVEMNLPCLNWFMEHCLESFEKNLDELDISM